MNRRIRIPCRNPAIGRAQLITVIVFSVFAQSGCGVARIPAAPPVKADRDDATTDNTDADANFAVNSRAASEPAYPPGAVLMVPSDDLALKTHDEQIKLVFGDFVQVVSGSGAKLTVSMNGRRGTINRDNLILLADARALLSDRLQKNPSDVPALWTLGRLYRRFDRFILAAQQYQLALNIEPENAKVHNALGYLYRRSDMLDDALEHYSKAIEHDPDYVRPYVNRAYVHYLKKDYEAGLKDCDAALKINSKCPTAWRHRGIIVRKQGDLEKAISHYTKSIQYSAVPGAGVLVNRAHAYADRGQFALACTDMAAAIGLDGSNAQSNLHFAPWAEKVLEQDAAHLPAHLLMGVHLSRLHQFQEAELHFKAAVEGGLKSHVPHLFRGYCHWFHNQLDDAREDLERALQHGPHDSDVYWILTKVYDQQGRTELAIDVLGNAIAIDATKMPFYARRAQLSARLDETDFAMRDIDRALEISPDLAKLHHWRGKLAYQLGDHDEALQSFRMAVDLDPLDSAAQEDLAHAWLDHLLPNDSERPHTESRVNISLDDGVSIQAREAVIDALREVETTQSYKQMLSLRPKFLEEALVVIRPYVSVPTNIGMSPVTEILRWFQQQSETIVRQRPNDYDLQFNLKMGQFHVEQLAKFETGSDIRLRELVIDRMPIRFRQIAEEQGLLGSRIQLPIDIDSIRRVDSRKSLVELESTYLQLIEQRPEVSLLWLSRGNLRQSLGRFAEARADFDQVVELAPTSYLARQRRAISLVSLNDLDAAIADLRACADLPPDWHVPVHWRVRECARKRVLGLMQAAIQQNSTATMNLTWLRSDEGPYVDLRDPYGWQLMREHDEQWNKNLITAVGEKQAAVEYVRLAWATAEHTVIHDNLPGAIMILEQWQKILVSGFEDDR